MRKKILFLILVITLIILITSVTLCNNTNKEEKDNKINYDYGEKMAYIKKENGWYYYLYTNTNNDYFFDGCNLKYPDLENYYINIYKDRTEQEIVQKFKTFPTLSTSDNKKKNATLMEREEVEKIDDFFNNTSFSNIISETDLENLNLENFNNNDIIKLYNELYEKKFSTDIIPYALHECDYKSDSSKDGFYVFIGFLIERKGIAAIEIDLVFDNGEYLSDKINNNTASKKEIKIYENLQNIEKYVIDNQTFDNLEENINLNDSIYKRIYKILSSIERIENGSN